MLKAARPCQPYSKAGNMKGVDDVRSKPAEMVVHYIATKKPRSFCLENVYSLVESFPDWFNTIIFTLREISGDDGKLYEARRGENQERFQNFKDCLCQNLRFGWILRKGRFHTMFLSLLDIGVRIRLPLPQKIYRTISIQYFDFENAHLLLAPVWIEQ